MTGDGTPILLDDSLTETELSEAASEQREQREQREREKSAAASYGY